MFLATVAHFEQRRDEVVRQKAESLIQECEGYLTLALQGAEDADTNHDNVRDFIRDVKQHLQEFRTRLRLVTQEAARSTRSYVESTLEPYRQQIQRSVTDELIERYPSWARSISRALEGFESWLDSAMRAEMLTVSDQQLSDFADYIQRNADQLQRTLQDFRDRLSRHAETLTEFR